MSEDADRPADERANERDEQSDAQRHNDEQRNDEREVEERDDERSAPLSDLATGVRERETDQERDDEFDDLFSEMDVADVDGEQAWRDLLAEQEGEPLAVGERVADEEDRDVRVIENRTCHNCQYFGEPPELHCTHEGTEIRRVVDTDHYEVVDCPMVVDEEEFDLPDAE